MFLVVKTFVGNYTFGIWHLIST